MILLIKVHFIIQLGFASGSLVEDSFSIRTFMKSGRECMISQSFAKNMGLYGERCGALHCVVHPQVKDQVSSQLSQIIRVFY